MTTKTAVNPADVLDQAAQTYFGAVRNGLKLQEDIATRWVNLFTKADGGEYLPQALQQGRNALHGTGTATAFTRVVDLFFGDRA